MKKETRQRKYLSLKAIKESLSLRNETIDGQPVTYLEGHAAVFNVRSKLIYEDGQLFYEILEHGCFDDVLGDQALNCIFVREHEKTKMLARNKSYTLSLSTDEKGLKFSARSGDTVLWKETLVLVDRGDLYACSFTFSVREDGEEWSRTEDGTPLRTIKKVYGLYDVAIVIDGAYNFVDVESVKRAISKLPPTAEQKIKIASQDSEQMEMEINLLKLNT